VLSFDPAVGGFESADVLIEGKKIAAVETGIPIKRSAIQTSAVPIHHRLQRRISDGIP
jgi:hypothetical protein